MPGTPLKRLQFAVLIADIFVGNVSWKEKLSSFDMSQVLIHFDQSHAGKNITDNNSSYKTQFMSMSTKREN